MPPVPGKHGYPGPKEGFSPGRLRHDFALLPGRGERSPAETQADYRVLALRVAFSDTPIESSAAYYNRLLFFMNQYWNQVSGGKVTLQPTLWDSVFTLPQTMAYYGDDDRFQERVVFMIRDLVALADSTVDFRPYESIVVFHAGKGQEADVLDNSRGQLWSAFLTPEDFKAVLTDSTGGVGIKTNDAITPGNFYRVKEVVELPESESQDGYVFGMTGVTCHEFGHQLGLPDLYDTTGDLNGFSQGLGSWDIMAAGVWNANGFVPCEPSAWSKASLDFIRPALVSSNQAVTLSQVERAVGVNPRLIQIPVTQTEYFLLENRRQDLDGNGAFTFDDVNGDGAFDFYTDSYQGAEFDFFLPGDGAGSGILAYHVDQSKIDSGLQLNVVNGDRDRKGIDLVEADGIQDLDDPPSGFNGGSPDDVFRAGWRDRWTPDTTPSTEAYGHVRTGISVANISAPESLMTFNVSFQGLKPGWPVVIGGRARNGGVPPLAYDLDGDQKPELIVPVQRLNNTGALYIFKSDGTDFRDSDLNPATRNAFLTTPSAVTATPCVGDIDGDGIPEIVFQTLDGAIYAVHADSTELADGDNNPATFGILVPGSGAGGGGQAILADLNGDGGMEIITGRPSNALAGTFLKVYRDSSGTITTYLVPMGGSTATPAAAADLNGDGLPEVIVTTRAAGGGGDATASGLAIVNWEILRDPLLPRDPDQFFAYMIRGGRFSAPVIVDLNRDGIPEVVVADRFGSIHALHVAFAPHIPGDLPSTYITTTELPGWPTASLSAGTLSEVSVGDLEHDGYPEVFHMGGDCLVAGVHYSGSQRSGYPLSPQDALAPVDSTGFWPPLIADVDRDGVLDVIPILPDGTRPAFRADGRRIAGFGQLGSTGSGSPPMLLDLDGDGFLDWVETFDQVPLDPRVQVEVHATSIPASPGSVAWSQYRFGPTRDGFFPPSPAGPPPGTSILSQVYAFPNPSRAGTTSIHYRLAGPARAVRLKIMDPTGHVISEPATGAADLLGSAEHAIPWNHAAMASGVYLCRVEVQSDRGVEVVFTKLAVVR
ncbi:MAG: M6 family metalloprotease domain-containing protein [Candidatus Eisenbacteria bacterium]|uniref:M6 family metalloprotease domain-containing protein n=1 Tax=Eiseniibacteriota bacterium TaxID=2212470 RepID=A0A538TSH2_UNCEI|nr:MAG: M6 family metalloprotease domain-containing protein [Candidatus Eisenbacteria bacterium]